MNPSGVKLARQSRSAALLAAACSLVMAPPAASALECPDPATVSAAQLLEFKTMMMVVALRCKPTGVMIADQNEEMAATRRTMFEEADGRVRRYLFDNNRPAPMPPAPVAGAVNSGVKAKAPIKSPSKVLPKGPVKILAHAPVKATLPPPPRSRREDPYEKYLTRVGTLHGMGDSSLGTCRKYHGIVSILADRTTPNRTLTLAADRLIGTPVLEKHAGCVNKPYASAP